jgi:hypothetical protein
MNSNNKSLIGNLDIKINIIVKDKLVLIIYEALY